VITELNDSIPCFVSNIKNCFIEKNTSNLTLVSDLFEDFQRILTLNLNKAQTHRYPKDAAQTNKALDFFGCLFFMEILYFYRSKLGC